MREFESGATRNDDTEQFEYSGFLSPVVLQEFASYMHKHRVQANGDIRSSRNWRKGIPKEAYEESLLRHVMDTWLHLDGWEVRAREDLISALCGILFNTQGLLHEILVEQGLGRGRVE